jgi:L-lactate dehydrogenase
MAAAGFPVDVVQSHVMVDAGRTKLAVIGAGAVGTTIAYAAMLRGLTREIVLIDLQAAKAEAEAKDLLHGSLFVPRVDVRAGSVADCAGARVVVITAGAKQKPGQTRLDLMKANTAMLRDLLPDILQAAPNTILLMVSNPVDVLTYAAWKLTGLSRARVFGSGTVLDTARFRALLSARLGVSAANIHGYIVGEHGDSEVPVWSSLQIGNVPLNQFQTAGSPPLTALEKEEIFHNVRDAAAQVISAKGATNWAVGLSVARILEAILRDEHRILPVSTIIEDWCGLRDVCLSLPVLVDAAGVGVPLALSLDETERDALRRSASILQEACRSLGF